MAQRSAPPSSSLSTPRIVASPWAVLIVVALGFFMILLDTTIVNVAIPSIITSLNASLDQILWILNGYILVYAVLLITAGRLGDMVGPKKLFLLGLVIFTAASAASGLAQDPNQLILFRVIQGVGGAILTPQSLSIITSIFPPEQRGAAFGIWSSVAGLAAVTGPTLGGFLTTTFSWRAIFYVNVPIGIVAVILASLMMPELTIHRQHRLDILGVLLASVGLFAIVFGLIQGEPNNWGRIHAIGSIHLGSLASAIVSIPSILAAGVILLIVFVLVEARQAEPLLPLSLFRDRNFTIANSVSAIVAFGMLGLFLPMTIFLQSVLGLSAEDAGVVMVPTSLTSMFVGPLAGRLSDRFNGKWFLFSGLLLFSLGFALVIAVASLHSTGWSFTLPLIVAGVGMGCTFAPMVTLAMRNIAPAQAGAASGFINTVRQVGGTVGLAAVGALLQNRLAIQLHTQAVKYAAALPPQIRPTFIAGYSHAASSGFQLGRGQTGGAKVPANLPHAVIQHIDAIGKLVFDHAYLNAMKPTLAMPITVMALGAVVTLFMPGNKGGAAQRQWQPQAVPGEEAAAVGE